jgi:hypothetical protein
MNISAIFRASEQYYIEVITRDTGPIIIAIPYPLTGVTPNERIEVSDFNTNRNHPFYILHQCLVSVRYIFVDAMIYKEGTPSSSADYIMVRYGNTVFLAELKWQFQLT